MTSYSTVTNSSTGTSSTEAVGWTATFVDDEGNEIDQPDWLTAFTLAGDGSTSAANYDATVAAQTGETNNGHTDTLRNETLSPTKGSDTTPWDLSTNAEYGASTDVNTANCYLVNAPGTYCLPLVYGNGVEGGTENTESYITDGSGAGKRSRYKDHNNSDIEDPYIYNTYVPATASLVWEDVNGLISDIDLFADGKYLKFTVPRDSIAQGNAVVAVKDGSGNIMWSWHIWVTDYVLGTNVKPRSSQDATYYILPYNLGWVDGQTTNFAERSVKVKFRDTCKLPWHNVT